MRPPPGYPFAGELKSAPPPPLDRERGEKEGGDNSLGAVSFILAFAAAMTGAGFMLAGLVASEARRAAAPPAEAQEMLMSPLTNADNVSDGLEPSSRVVDAPLHLAPPIERNVPVFPTRFLEGCSAHDLATLDDALSAAIARGSRLYNDGDVLGCTDAYEHAAGEIESAMASSCSGPVKAMAEGRAAASKLVLPSARAWAMRDSFDGLVDVLERSRAGGIENL